MALFGKEHGRMHAQARVWKFEDEKAYQAHKSLIERVNREGIDALFERANRFQRGLVRAKEWLGRRMRHFTRRYSLENLGYPGLKELVVGDHNILLNEGINEMWNLICGNGGTAYSNANAEIGVGDSNAAEDASQTDLQGTYTTYKGMDAGYPTSGTNQKAVFQATFGENEANHDWKEWTVRNGATAGKNMNRKVQDMGTKNGGTWVLTVEISLS